MAINTVIFDLGNVLLDVNRKYLLDKVFTCSKRMNDFFDNVCTRTNWQIPINQGASPQDLVVSLSEDFPEYTSDIETFNEQWGALIGGPIEESVQILEELSENNIDLYALTDWPEGKFGIVEDRFPKILSHFKDVAISSVEKVAKPDFEIYRILLERNGLSATECMYVDDRLENVIAAQNLGMSGHHFEAPEKLRTDLVQRKLL